MKSKRTERLVVMVSPAAWDQYAARASALGMSVALWAARTLDRASVGPVPSLSDHRASEAWLERYLAVLNAQEAESLAAEWPAHDCVRCGGRLGAQNAGDTCDSCKLL